MVRIAQIMYIIHVRQFKLEVNIAFYSSNYFVDSQIRWDNVATYVLGGFRLF